MNMPSLKAPPHDRLTRWLLLFILLLALFLRLEGIHWPPYHPDEPVIAGWLQRGEPDRAYPGGFFTLARPLRWTWERIEILRHRLAMFKGISSEPAPPRPNYILMARYINVWLAVATCLFIYWAGRAISGSRAYALLSAALMAASQYHVEHSHYAESDIAMIFTLAAALAAWLQFITSERVRWFLIAALAMGFAGGTKFTLVTLWPAIIIFPIIGKTPRHFSNVWKWRLGGAALAALLLIAGFVVATPAVTDWREFWTSMVSEAGRVYRETRLNMGPLADDQAVRLTARIHDFAAWSFSLGIPWLVLWAISTPVLFAPGSRRAWVPLVLAPVLFLLYWIFKSPWVRTQEYMVFLPFAALAAPWAPLYAWRRGGRAARTVVILACVAAFLGTAIRGARTASIFGWTDTRDIATRWLALCAPADATYAKEKYADATPPAGAAIPIRMVAHHDARNLQQRGIDFVLRNGAEGDRGMVHPVTGKRFAEFEQRYREFTASAERLRVLAPLPPPDTLTTFNSICMELYGLPRFAQWPTITHPLSQPAFITRNERWTYFPIGRHLGPVAALELTRDGITCAVGGPDDLAGPIYAIIYTKERPAIVSLKGFGRRWTVRLAPYDARVITLIRPVWKPRWSHFEKITARVLPQRNIYRVPCYMQIAFSRAEARRILHDLGSIPSPDFAVSPSTDLNRRRIAQVERLATETPENFGVGPNSAWYYDQFARLRITNEITIEWDPPPSAGSGPARARLAFPIMLTPAPCTLSFEAVVESGEFSLTSVPCTIYEAGNSEPLATITFAPGATNSISLSLPDGRFEPLVLRLETVEPLSFQVRRAELTWNIRDVLRHEAADLRLALAEQLVQKRRPGEALEILAALPESLCPEADLRRRRIIWQAQAALESRDAAAAAQALLAVAPNHLGALETLALTDAKAAEKLETLRRVPLRETPLRWHRFALLCGAAIDQPAQTVQLLLEITEDFPPPLVLRMYARRHNRWKPLADAEYNVPFPRKAAEGERYLISVPLPQSDNLGRVAIAIESDVRWHPGRLPSAGFEDGFIPLDRLLTE